MAESVVRSSITSGSSAAKPPASKRNARGNRASHHRDQRPGALLAELARLAEMSTVERRLRGLGFRRIAGTDEVGRGCLAGPVVAAAVVLDADSIVGVRDSKELSHETRLQVLRSIMRVARAISVGVVEPSTIDRINILEASKLAMKRAVDDLVPRPDVLLVDAVFIENLQMPQLAVIRGDSRCVSVAAASIVAKVYRDLLMESYDVRYPLYDFASNRGYGTGRHREALMRHGASPIHRMSFESLSTGWLFE